MVDEIAAILGPWSRELKKYKRHSQIIEALRTLDNIANIEEIGA